MLRNVTSRLIAVYFLTTAVSMALVLGFVYWRVGGVIDAEQRAVVEAEMRGLADDYGRGGTLALVRAINQRLQQPQSRDAVYLLADARGGRITGNLAGWPPTLAPETGWTTLDLYRLDRSGPTKISALAVGLPGDDLLLVGRDVEARAAFDATLARALLWALLAVAALALLTGWLLSRLVSGRIGEIGGAAREIMGGALDRRIAVRGTGDEFDRLGATLNAMLDRIEALVRDLRMVTDSLAHDLRSPLGRLVRDLEAARDAEGPPEARTARIERALREAETVIGMSSALLEISRVEAGIGADQFEPVDLGRLAADVAELYEAAAEDGGVLVVCRGGPAVMVRGHRQLLAQAASNLVENALKHAPPGSEVVVAAAAGPEAAELSVADRGPGIPEAERERALGRFVRLDPSRGEPGAGLGLALVAAVARMHGGEVVLADNGPGLVARLRLPMSTRGRLSSN